MKDLDVLTLALLVLTPEELDDCYLKAFHKLPEKQQGLIEDVGLKVMDVAHMQRAEDALEVPAKLGLHLQTAGTRVVRRQIALWI